jgi:hypothetical protein
VKRVHDAGPSQPLECAIPQRPDEPLHHRDRRLDEISETLQLDSSRADVEITLPLEVALVIPYRGVEHNAIAYRLAKQEPSPLPLERRPCAQHGKPCRLWMQRDLRELVP